MPNVSQLMKELSLLSLLLVFSHCKSWEKFWELDANYKQFLYVTNGVSASISGYSIDAGSGLLSALPASPFLVPVASNPQGLAIHPSGKFLYTGLYGTNAIAAFAIDSTGALTSIGSPVAAGANPTDIVMHPSGNFVYASNYGNDSVSAYAIDGISGALSPISGSPFIALAPDTGVAGLTIDPSGRFLYATDNASGRVLLYPINTNGSLGTSSEYAGGAAPEYLAIDAAGKYLYTTENGNDRVQAYTINNSTGVLGVGGVPTAPFNMTVGSLPDGLKIDPSSKFLYAANRGTHAISAFAINNSTGDLIPIAGSPISTGATSSPYGIAIDASGKYLYVTDLSPAGGVTGYAINSSTGFLTPLGVALPTGANPNIAAIARITQ